MFLKLSWICLIGNFLGIVKCSNVIDLDNMNFEKLTQVASGHSTGDWLVKVRIAVRASFRVSIRFSA
jgi:hypothetical protein